MSHLIFDEQFRDGRLPSNFYTDTPVPKVGAEGWNCQGWDGVVASFPHDAWTRLTVEVELTDIGTGATAFCGTDARTSLTVSLNTPLPRHQAGDGGLVILHSATPLALEEGKARLVFDWTAETMSVTANGRDVLSAPNLRRSARAGSLQMGFSRCHVRRIVASGRPMATVPAAPRALKPGYPLEVTVDFNDDLMACAWTQQTFEALFAELQSWGVRRVSWIDLGRQEDGYFDYAPLGTGEHGQETFRAVGDIFATAVEQAHRQGIELVGLIKPYDMAIQGHSFAPGSDMAKKHGRIHRLGVSYGWATHMAADHQHLLMARKPSAWGPAINTVWTRIDLVKDDDAAASISPADITITVSDDNETFHPYTGPIRRTERVEAYPVYRSTPSGPVSTTEKRMSRVFRFEDLDIREPFVALEVKGTARSFVNRLCDLIHLFGEKGEETRLTYGLSLRKDGFAAQFLAGPGQAEEGHAIEGSHGGFEFNRYPGSPSAGMTSGGDPIVTPLALDRGARSFIGLARGKDRSPMAIMSPSFPETRSLWMGWVTAMLDAGADGIDIRPGNHHADFAWIEYGFEEPVRSEMLTCTGVDIWETDDFDYDLWRRIRGEGWTQFVREVSAVVRGRGKKLTVHIDSTYDGAPGTGGSMNLVCDWRTWITEGLIDGVTGKSLWPDAAYSLEVLALAHANGVPVTFAPYCCNLFEERTTTNHMGDSPVGCAIPVERLIEWGKRSGYDSFLLYECASALRAKPDGTVQFRRNAEPVRAMLQRHFNPVR